MTAGSRSGGEAGILLPPILASADESYTVAQYRDPVLTRGAQGEAIFKSVSPSVVAIVVGSISKDDRFEPDGLDELAGSCCWGTPDRGLLQTLGADVRKPVQNRSRRNPIKTAPLERQSWGLKCVVS